MHLLIPHAGSADAACRHALSHLQLPQLSRLLARWSATGTWGGEDDAPHMPAEMALAAACGQAEPTPAAWAANEAAYAWARVTPVHLAVGSDGVDMAPPHVLELSATEWQDLATVAAQLWPADEGWACKPHPDGGWLIAHATLLDGMEAASLDRVAGGPIEPWLPQARMLKRWQNEAQMLLHTLPVNAAREAAGQLAVNSVWISDIGRAGGPAPQFQVEPALTAPWQEGDLATWCEAWQALDAGAVTALLAAADSGQTVSLTLAGPRFARRFEPRSMGLAQRLRSWLGTPPAATVLETL
jgi:hypothetical protein